MGICESSNNNEINKMGILENNNEYKTFIQNQAATNHAAQIPEEASDKLYNSIVKIVLPKIYGTGFFMTINIKEKKRNFLLTNFHVISLELIDSKQTINIYYGKKEFEIKKTIKLDVNERFIRYFDEPIDITIIEILPKDNIPEHKYLFPDLNYRNGGGYNDYKEKDFYLAGYPTDEIYKGDRHISSGKIEKIYNNFEFEHTLDASHGSSGSPICLISNKCVIGIHKSGDEINHTNYGTFIGKILDELESEQKSNYIIAEIYINDSDIKENIRIMNSFDQYKNNINFIDINN